MAQWLNDPMTRWLNASMTQWPDRDLLEVDHVVVAVVLEADVAFVGPASPIGLVGLFLGWHGFAFGVVRDLHAVQYDDRVRSVQRNLHGVPLACLLRASQGFRQ